MICPDCNDPAEDAGTCLRCDGIGHICDRCGESADEPGELLCQNCREDVDYD